MPTKQQIGARGAVLVNGRDVTKYSKNFSATKRIGVENSTGLQPEGDAETFIQALEGGAVSFRGMLPVAKSQAQKELELAYGTPTQAGGTRLEDSKVLIGPYGLAPTYLGVFLRSIPNTVGLEGMTPNITGYNQDYEATRGLRYGTMLHSSQGEDSVLVSTIFSVEFVDVDADRVVTFYDADGNIVGTVTIVNGSDAATIQADLRALGAPYAAAVVTGALAGASGATVNEVQRIHYDNGPVEEGTFTLDGQATGTFSFATGNAATLQALLEALPNIGAGNVSVTEVLVNQTYDVEFIGALAGVNVSEIVANDFFTVTVTTTTEGSGAGGPYNGTFVINTSYDAALLPEPTNPDADVLIDYVRRGGERTNVAVVDAAFNGEAIYLPDLDYLNDPDAGAELIIQVPYASDDLNATVRLQHADDDGGGAPGAFTTVNDPAEPVVQVITEKGAYWFSIPPDVVLKDWVCVAISPAQITGELAFAAAIDRNWPQS